MPLDLTDEERAALLRLLEAEPDNPADAIRAVIVAATRRRGNTTDGRLAIQVAKRHEISWRELSEATGYAPSTLRDWGKTPPATDEGDDQ